MEATRDNTMSSHLPETWTAWPVCWSAVWVGALSALAALILFGLAGISLGLQLTGVSQRITDWNKVTLSAAACAVLASFFAFAIAGWVAAKIGGYTRSEPAMLHGAIAWLVAVPVLMLAATAGGAGYMGGWYSGLAGTPSWAAPGDPRPADYDTNDAAHKAWDARQQEAAKLARNAALGAITALLLGLMGSVLGGWMASGEPMTLTHHHYRTVRSGATTSVETERKVQTHA